MADWASFGGRRAAPVQRTGPFTSNPGTSPQGGNTDPAQIQQLIQQFLQGKPAGDATMSALKDYLAQQGIQIEIPTHAGGSQSSDDKIVLPGGQVIDLYGDAGGADTPQWIPDGYWVDGRPSSTPGTWTDPMAGESQGGSGLPGGLPSGYLATPWGGQVGMPDPSKMAESPSFQWNMSRGLDALEKFHGAKGTLNAGGANKDAMEFASGLASQEYDKNFGRMMSVNDFNRGTHWGDTDRIYGRFSDMTRIGAGAAGDYANNVSSLYQNSGAYNAANAANQNTNWGNLAGAGLDTLFAWQQRNRNQNGGA